MLLFTLFSSDSPYKDTNLIMRVSEPLFIRHNTKTVLQETHFPVLLGENREHVGKGPERMLVLNRLWCP